MQPQWTVLGWMLSIHPHAREIIHRLFQALFFYPLEYNPLEYKTEEDKVQAPERLVPKRAKQSFHSE
jgi:hypothetical protein